MTAKVTKTTKTTVSVSWNGTVEDDGKTVARMTGTLDLSHPLGNTSLFIVNRPLYEANADAVKTAYESFTASVQKVIEGIGDLNTTTTETSEE